MIIKTSKVNDNGPWVIITNMVKLIKKLHEYIMDSNYKPTSKMSAVTDQLIDTKVSPMKIRI